MPRIKDIEVHRVDLELTRPYTIAFKTVRHVENAIVKVVLDNGLVGWGSGNPSEQVVGVNLDQTLKALGIACNRPVHKDPWQRLLDRDIEQLSQLCQEIQDHLPQYPAARAALEIALYDAYCQHQELPLARFLGQKIEALPTSITIGIKSVEETLAEAEEYLGMGFRALKVKLGNELNEDIERVLRLREEIGKDIPIRVDANQGYSLDDLNKFYLTTQKVGLELIEQPLAADDHHSLHKLDPPLKSIIAADESLITVKDARKLSEPPGACGIFNIKLMKCGGISPALAIADVADQNQIDLMWGCNDESIISISAALHTAFSCSGTKYLDLDGSLDLARDVVEGGFVLEQGIMRINDKAGLGVNPSGLV